MGTLTRRPRRAALRAGLALGLLAVLLSGCDLFKPATPEAGSGGTTLLPDYSHPESCLVYMKIGIERKDNPGQDAYLGALADTANDHVAGFHAFFDAAVWNAYTGIKPADWDLLHETQFLSVFVRLKAAQYEMLWLPDVDHIHDETSPDGNQMILHRRYEVRALQQPPVLIAVGYADLYFTKISGSRWALTRWQDRVAPDIGAPPTDPEQQSFGSRRLNLGAGG